MLFSCSSQITDDPTFSLFWIQSWIRLLRLQLSSGLTGVLGLETQIQRAEEVRPNLSCLAPPSAWTWSDPSFPAASNDRFQLAKLDRAKTTFFSNVSHELRTPLTLIQGPVSDLLTGEKDPAKKKMLEVSPLSLPPPSLAPFAHR